MNTTKIQIIIAAIIIFCQTGKAQSFVNLDFEDATIIPVPSSPYYPYAVYASDAIPGWTAVGFLSPNEILYNDVSLGATSVSLLGNNGGYSALDGAYSIDLYGGSGLAAGASISQTGLVPADAASIQFIAVGGAPGNNLLISLGGQNIPFSVLSTSPNYRTFGGNIPLGLANQSEQLTFTAPNGNNNYWEIDDIQFSPSSVPEPSVLDLFALSGLLLAWRRWIARTNLAAQ
jgi:hypothetical protein